ncbi:MAG: type II secretion system F family protein [Planctomycetaceae bacterium]|nr:type II secretion system F family protein [Planctomycetaceae bacterium]
MFPAWLRLTLYIAAAFAGVWLLFRLWQSRRASKQYVPWQRKKPIASRPATVATPTAVRAMSVESTPVTAPQIASSGQSARSEAASWEQQTLFDRQREDNRLPRVLVEDLPIARQDDLAYGALTPVFASLMPESETRQEDARRELQSAGFYAPHALQNFAATRYLFTMVGLIVAGVALLLVPQQYEWLAVTGLIALPLLGWAIPRLYVRGKAADRRSEIERGMPDLLDMLNMCVSQGLTIPDALKRILPDLRGPYPALAQELRIVTEQAAIGTLPVALDNFSHRIDIPEVHSFASLLTQTERMGTSISEALVSYSDTMRESLQQRADEKGNRATFKLLFPTVLCLMPAVYLFLLGPAIIELSNFFYSGGRDALDQGSAVIERINQQRAQGPFRDAAP